MGCIYKLLDPISNEIRYIGQTSVKLDKRIYHHYKDCIRKTTHVNRWLKSILDKNLKPIVEILEICNNSELNEREIFYIAKYKNSSNLCNHSLGGNGIRGFKMSEETKIKMSYKHKGKVLSEEHKLKLSIAKKGIKFSDEHKKNMSLVRKGKCINHSNIPIIQYDLEGNFIKEWESGSQAARELNYNQANIYSVCVGRRKKCKNFIWKFKVSSLK